MCIDANNLYGYAMSESLPYDEIKFDKNINLEDIKKTPDGNDNGYFVEVDINYPDEIKEKTKYFPIAPEKKNNPDNFTPYVNKNRPVIYTHLKKLIGDRSDKRNYLIHYWMLKITNRNGKSINKTHERIPFEQSERLEKYIHFDTTKTIKDKKFFEKDFFTLLKNWLYGKIKENVKNRTKIISYKKR